MCNIVKRQRKEILYDVLSVAKGRYKDLRHPVMCHDMEYGIRQCLPLYADMML